MQTVRGKQFWPMDPRPEDFDIRDIAHALSMLCRFGGHCLRYYSVAEHSVLMTRRASQPNRLVTLLHDASEAYLVDMPSPVKKSMPEYRIAEGMVQVALAKKYALPYPFPGEVHDLDTRILTDEVQQNMAPRPQPWDVGAEPLGVTLQFWSPEQACYEFLREYVRAA